VNLGTNTRTKNLGSEIRICQEALHQNARRRVKPQVAVCMRNDQSLRANEKTIKIAESRMLKIQRSKSFEIV
jgi:hypothetical protein